MDFNFIGYMVAMVIKKIDNLSLDQLESKAFLTLEGLSVIKLQIDEANIFYINNGYYENHEWYVSAKHALRMKGREHQMLCKELSARKKVSKKLEGEAFSQKFMTVAREFLDKDIYMQIMKITSES